MFRHSQRRRPFQDFINWTDYRWESNPWQRGPQATSRPWGNTQARPRGYHFLQVFLAGLAVVVGFQLMSSLRRSANRSWLERGVLAVLLLVVANYVSKRRQRPW
jgi:hypothetical protein